MAISYEQATAQLIDIGRRLYEHGMVPATSGNLSARLDDGHFAITVSGRHKGHLAPADIMRVNAQGESLDERRPSAETLLHTQVYAQKADINVVLHPHSINATVISRQHQHDKRGDVVLAGYELLKAFPGINTHATELRVPIFSNDQNIARLAKQVDLCMQQYPEMQGYLIESHGFYTWGASAEDAMRHIEAFEFLFACELRMP